MALEAIALATLAVIVPVLVGVLIALRRRQPLQKAKQLEALVPRIDPEKRAERQARRKARRAKVAEMASAVAEGVRDGLGNLDEDERAEVQQELVDAAQEWAEAGAALAALAAKISAGALDPVTALLAATEIADAVRESAEVIRLVRDSVAD